MQNTHCQILGWAQASLTEREERAETTARLLSLEYIDLFLELARLCFYNYREAS